MASLLAGMLLGLVGTIAYLITSGLGGQWHRRKDGSIYKIESVEEDPGSVGTQILFLKERPFLPWKKAVPQTFILTGKGYHGALQGFWAVSGEQVIDNSDLNRAWKNRLINENLKENREAAMAAIDRMLNAAIEDEDSEREKTVSRVRIANEITLELAQEISGRFKVVRDTYFTPTGEQKVV